MAKAPPLENAASDFQAQDGVRNGSLTVPSMDADDTPLCFPQVPAGGRDHKKDNLWRGPDASFGRDD